ncbi:MAG: septum formation initiator family protein [Thermodesulfobacteriota bacterium]|nr:septum formation initiator family protein [Thermodesulfobacteriota bacterium]
MKVGRYLIVFVLLMGLLITFGDKGLVDNYMIKEKLAALRNANGQMTHKNKELKKKIVLLRNDLRYIEMVARSEIGMVKKGDIIYRFSD